MKIRSAWALFLVAATCIERAPGSGAHGGERDRAAAAAYLSPPPPQHRVGAVFGNAIELVGYDLAPPSPRAGDRLTLTLQWLVRSDVSGRYEVFVHLDGRAGEERLQGDHWPAGGTLATDDWRPGDRLRDPVTIQIPSAYRAGALDVYVGLYSGEERLPLTTPGTGRSDGHDRLLLATLPLR